MFQIGEKGKIEFPKKSKRKLGDRVQWCSWSHGKRREGKGTILFPYYTININYMIWKNLHYRVLCDDNKIRTINSIESLNENIITENLKRIYTSEILNLVL